MPKPPEISFTFKGNQTIARKMRQAAGSLPRQADQATFQEAEEIAADAKANYVPVDEGNLRDSIHAVKDAGGMVPTPGRLTFASAIVAGGPDAPHALAVHEHPGSHDPPTWRGKTVNFTRGGPKYIERPMRAAERGMGKRIADVVEKELRRVLER